MASDLLFYELGKAMSQPSHAYRAAMQGLAIPGQALEGYQTGLQARADINNAKIMNTPLGSIVDPSRMPSWIHPDTTVGQFLAVTSKLDPYVRSSLMSQMLGTETGLPVATSSGTVASSANPVATAKNANFLPPASSAPVNNEPPPIDPTGAVDISQIPFPSDTNSGPAPTPLDNLQATGQGAGNNIAPAAPMPQPVPTAGNSGATGVPSAPAAPNFNQVGMTIPPEMSPMEAQRFGPVLKAAGQRNMELAKMEQERNTSAFNAAQENTRAAASRTLTGNQAIATQMDEFAKAVVRPASGFDALSQLSQALNAVPPGQTGPTVGIVTKNLGPWASGRYPETASFNDIRNGFIGDFAAALDPAGRQNVELLHRVSTMAPTVQDSIPARNNKLKAMYGYLNNVVNRNYDQYSAAAQQLGGNIPKPKVPALNDILAGGPNRNPPYKTTNTGNPNTAIASMASHQKALDWANANPNDPRAIQIKSMANQQLAGGAQ